MSTGAGEGQEEGLNTQGRGRSQLGTGERHRGNYWGKMRLMLTKGPESSEVCVFAGKYWHAEKFDQQREANVCFSGGGSDKPKQ